MADESRIPLGEISQRVAGRAQVSEISRRVAELDATLARMRPAYEQARVNLASPARGSAIETAWQALETVLALFQPGDTGDKALYLLGQCQQIVSRVNHDQGVVNAYEAIRERRRNLEAPGG